LDIDVKLHVNVELATREVWKKVADVMKAGGFWDLIMKSGPELDRVKTYLNILDGTEEDVRSKNDPYTQARSWIMPIFPGLQHYPFRDPKDYEWVPMLESKWEALREEGLKVNGFFTPSAVESLHQGGRWMQGNISAFGSKLPEEAFQGLVPKVALDLGDELPGFACYNGHPFGHYLYSVMEPGIHLPAHTSSDNLKIRAHLGLIIPENCRIKVGHEERNWEEGKVLVLEDSLLHEVWNDSDSERMVLIVDFWHPDLTRVEVDALSAGLGKWEIRRLLAPARNIPQEMVNGLTRLFKWEEKDDPTVRGYWPDHAEIQMADGSAPDQPAS